MSHDQIQRKKTLPIVLRAEVRLHEPETAVAVLFDELQDQLADVFLRQFVRRH